MNFYKRMNEPQPNPRKPLTKILPSCQVRASARCIEMGLHAVAAFIDARREMGVEKYGVELYANNGREPLVDSLQETGDLIVYLTQSIEECGTQNLMRKVKLESMRSMAIVFASGLIDLIKEKEAANG